MGHTACMGIRRNSHQIFIESSHGQRPHGRRRQRKEDTVWVGVEN